MSSYFRTGLIYHHNRLARGHHTMRKVMEDFGHLLNIFITGTPGTGKTLFSEKLSQELSFRHINLSQEIIDHKLYSSFDEEYNSYVIDEDKALNYLEPILKQERVIVDYHSCDFLPPHWFSVVIVLRTRVDLLIERYNERKYSDFKISQNIDSENFDVCFIEAFDHFGAMMLVDLVNNTEADMSRNVNEIVGLFS